MSSEYKDVRLIGYLESGHNDTITGWAFNLDEPEGGANVIIMDDEGVLAIVRGDSARADVEQEYGYSGPCQFRYRLPNHWKGDLKALRVFVSKSNLLVRCVRDLEHESRSLFPRPVSVDIKALADDHQLYELQYAQNHKNITTRYERKDRKALSEKCVLFEISDLFHYLRHHNTVTGIQRTECGVISSLFDTIGCDSARFAFCALTDKSGYVRILIDEDLKVFIRDVFNRDLTVAEQIHRIGELIETGHDYQVNGPELFFVLGAYWIIPNIETKLHGLIERGVSVGLYAYDFIPVNYPQFFDASAGRAFVEKVSTVVTLSSFIITISKYVAADAKRLIANEIGVDKPIDVTPLPQELISPTQLDRSQHRFAPAGEYVLCVCTIEPRKNHRLLYRIWAGLCRKHGRNNIPTLVIVGRWGWIMEDFKKLCESTAYLAGKINVRSDISDEELINLYQHCSFTVFPSFVEGWGLPVGESLSFGKPCAASNTSSIPEVGGDLIDYLDPYDYDNSFAVIERLILDRKYLASRSDAIKSAFVPRTWAEYSTSLLEKIEALGNLPPSSSHRLFPPRLRPGVVYKLEGLITDDTVGWSDRLVRFSLSMGWHELESWGAWSKQSPALIEFGTAFPPTTAVKVWLRLHLPNAYRGEQIGIITQQGDISLTGSELTQEPRWFSAACNVGEDGSIKLQLCRPYAYAAREIHRDLFVGISALAYHLLDDQTMELDLVSQFVNY